MKIAALALLALLAPAEPTLLRRTFSTDAVDTYKIEDHVQETVKSAMGETPVTIASIRTYAVRTTKVDVAAGTAQFEARTTVEKLDATGSAASMMGEKPKPIVQTGKVDVRGRMSFDPTATADALAGLLSGSQGTVSAGTFVEFPEKAVKIGDSWEIVVPKSPFVFDQDQRLTATLVGEKDVEGVAVWIVAVKGTIRTLVDSSKLPGGKSLDTPLGAMTMRVKGQVDLTGEGTVDKASGRTLTMATKGTSKMTIDLGDTGLTLDTVGMIDSAVKLQK